MTSHDIQHSDLIDWVIFSELLQMDEDEEGFSKSLVTTFVEQLLGIYTEIETIIDTCKARKGSEGDAEASLTSASLEDASSPTDEELVKLSSLGHYLKGSLLLLGLRKVQHQCERIQNYGNKKMGDLTEEAAAAGKSGPPTTNSGWLVLIEDLLNTSKMEFTKTKEILGEYFGEEF